MRKHNRGLDCGDTLYRETAARTKNDISYRENVIKTQDEIEPKKMRCIETV